MIPIDLIFTDLEALGIASAAATAAMLYVFRFFSFKVRLRWNHLWRYVRWAFQTFILRKSIARQRYHIAALENADPEAVFQELVLLGYQPNYFAYCDPGERYNLRRLRFCNGQLWQDHVRVFPDEVRGHSEISYEEDAALHARATTVEALPVETQQALQWAIQNVRLNALFITLTPSNHRGHIPSTSPIKSELRLYREIGQGKVLFMLFPICRVWKHGRENGWKISDARVKSAWRLRSWGQSGMSIIPQIGMTVI